MRQDIDSLVLSFHSKLRNLAPYDWYQNYTSLSHLLNPETLSGCARPTHSLSPNTLEDNSSDSTEAVDNGTRTKSYYLLQPDKCRVLILGCGNSTFGADMYEAGWTGGKKNENGARFVQVDFSPVVSSFFDDTVALNAFEYN